MKKILAVMAIGFLCYGWAKPSSTADVDLSEPGPIGATTSDEITATALYIQSGDAGSAVGISNNITGTAVRSVKDGNALLYLKNNELWYSIPFPKTYTTRDYYDADTDTWVNKTETTIANAHYKLMDNMATLSVAGPILYNSETVAGYLDIFKEAVVGEITHTRKWQDAAKTGFAANDIDLQNFINDSMRTVHNDTGTAYFPNEYFCPAGTCTEIETMYGEILDHSPAVDYVSVDRARNNAINAGGYHAPYRFPFGPLPIYAIETEFDLPAASNVPGYYGNITQTYEHNKLSGTTSTGFVEQFSTFQYNDYTQFVGSDTVVTDEILSHDEYIPTAEAWHVTESGSADNVVYKILDTGIINNDYTIDMTNNNVGTAQYLYLGTLDDPADADYVYSHSEWTGCYALNVTFRANWVKSGAADVRAGIGFIDYNGTSVDESVEIFTNNSTYFQYSVDGGAAADFGTNGDPPNEAGETSTSDWYAYQIQLTPALAFVSVHREKETGYNTSAINTKGITSKIADWTNVGIYFFCQVGSAGTCHIAVDDVHIECKATP